MQIEWKMKSGDFLDIIEISRENGFIVIFDKTSDKMFEKYLTKVIRWNEIDSKETSFSFTEKPQEKYYISFDDFCLTLEFPLEEELFYFELKYV